MLSAPAVIPATRHGTFTCALTPPGRLSRTCLATRLFRPARWARAITGTRPACDTRCGSSNVAWIFASPCNNRICEVSSPARRRKRKELPSSQLRGHLSRRRAGMGAYLHGGLRLRRTARCARRWSTSWASSHTQPSCDSPAKPSPSMTNSCRARCHIRSPADPGMARLVCGGAPPPSRGTRRSFQNRFAESIFGTHPLSGGASAPPPARDQGPGSSLPGPDAGHPLQAAGSHRERSRACPSRARSPGHRRYPTATSGQADTCADLQLRMSRYPCLRPP